MQTHQHEADRDSQFNCQMKSVVPRDPERCEVGGVRKGFQRKERGSPLERHKAPVEGITEQVAGGRTIFQIYQGSGDAKEVGCHLWLGNVCLLLGEGRLTGAMEMEHRNRKKHGEDGPTGKVYVAETIRRGLEKMTGQRLEGQESEAWCSVFLLTTLPAGPFLSGSLLVIP